MLKCFEGVHSQSANHSFTFIKSGYKILFNLVQVVENISQKLARKSQFGCEYKRNVVKEN